MRAISLFSGAGGFELGFDRAGIETLVQVERDPWCLEVLARHWPDKVRVRDVEHIGLRRSQPEGRRHVSDPAWRWPTEIGRTVDLVYGGWPCQDLSVAGNRAGLQGERSGLFHELVRVMRELRPRWIAAENVLGLLSNAEGRDFAIVLNSLVECGYGVAWRVLDGRYFGVPQRRRRVLIVGCLGDAARAAQVLAVCEGCGGHPAPRRTPRQDIAPTLDDGARGTSVELPMIAFHSKDHGQDAAYDLSPTVRAAENENGGTPPAVVIARGQPARESGYRMDFETENFLVANGLRASDGHHGYSSGRGDGADNLIASPLTASYAKQADSSDTSKGPPNLLRDAAGVRRLTPLECERLMGWPDEHTRWTSDGREISDAHRYRMCGNGMIATMAEWLGHRLVTANSW